MVAEPFRKRWTGEKPVGFDSSALCHTPGCSWESSQSPKLAHSVRITARAPDFWVQGGYSRPISFTP